MTDDAPPSLPQRKKLPFEQQQRPVGAAMQRGVLLLIYGLMAVGLGGVALYMASVNHMPLTSGYVAAPAIGAVWFGLRLFMMLNSRKSD